MQLELEEELEDLYRERELWLQNLGLRDVDVLVDRETGLEFVFMSGEDEECREHLTKVFLPYTLQRGVLANFH